MNNSTYKQTAIGLIPEDWEVNAVGKVCDFIVPGRNKPMKFDGDIPRLTTPDLLNKVIVFNSKLGLKISEEEAKKIGSKIVPKNSIIMSCVGDLGLLAVAGNRMVINQQLHAFIPKEKIDFLFLLYALSIQKKYIDRIATKTAVPYMNKDNCNSIPLPIPPLPEQQKIAKILSTFDQAINTTKQIVEELKVRNKGLVNKLILDNGELKVKLGNIFVESKIPTTNADVNKRITVRLTLKGIEKRGVRGSELEEATTYYLRKSGQFIYGKQNLHKGAFGIIPDELDGFESSSDIPAFDINKEFNSKYIFYYFTRTHFYEKLEDISTGTGSKRIQPRELYKVEIKVPSTLEKQNTIVKIIDTATKEITNYEQKLEALQLQKKGLMQQLLMGKVRVKF